MDLLSLVNEMRISENSCKYNIIKRINECDKLIDKCILIRRYVSPQSNIMENMIKDDLGIDASPTNSSGDGIKNGIKYEIKYSGHAKKSKLNFVQIRPDHDIDYYILIGYNMYSNTEKGSVYVFKVPSDELYNLVIKYGGYAHGTIKTLGHISHNNLKGRNCEYALRINPNARKTSKSRKILDALKKYSVAYKPEAF